MQMICIGMCDDGTAVVYSAAHYAQEDGLSHAFFEEIPAGSGLLKTDLTRLWWEEPQSPPAPPPSPEEDRDELLVDLDYRMTLLELGVM